MCGEVVDTLLDNYYLVEVWDDDTTNFIRYRWHQDQIKLKETKPLSKSSDFMPVNGLPTGRDTRRSSEDRSHWDEWWGRNEKPSSSNKYTAPPKVNNYNKTPPRRTTHSVSTAGLIRQEVTKLADNKSIGSVSEEPPKNPTDGGRVRKRRNNW